MDLEQRVEALEQEVEILKNQIQVTLLAIQEQLLNQRYAALRGEDVAADTTNSDPTIPSRSALNLVKTVSLNPAAQAEPVVPATRTAPFTTAAPTTAPTVTPKPFVRTAPTIEASPFDDTQPSKDWELLTRLEKWATTQIDKIGAKRTRELVKLYAKQGRINGHIYDELMQFIHIYETGDPLRTTVSAPAASSQIKRVSGGGSTNEHARVGSARTHEDRRTVVFRLIDALQNGGKSPHTT